MKLEDRVAKITSKVLLPFCTYAFFSCTPVSAKPTSESMYHFIAGNMGRIDGKLNSALENYLKALEADPESAYLYNEMAETLIDGDNIDAAVHYLNNAVRLDRDFIKPHTNLAAIYVLKKNFSAALQESDFVLARDKNNLSALSAAGESLFLTHNYSKAKGYFSKVVELKITPESVCLSSYRLGLINFSEGSYTSAINDFMRSFILLDKTDPFDRFDSFDILHYITLSYYRIGEFEEAKKTLINLGILMDKEVDPRLIPLMNELRQRIKDQDLIRKIDKGIQNNTNKATPNRAMPK